jgi:hypothetical protein
LAPLESEPSKDVGPTLPFDLPPAAKRAHSQDRGSASNGGDSGLSALIRARLVRLDPTKVAPVLARAEDLAQRLKDTPE